MHPFDPLELGGRQWAVKGRPGKITYTTSRNGGADVAVPKLRGLPEHVAHATGKPITFALCVVVELKCQRCWRTR